MFVHRDECEPGSGEGFPPELRPLSLMLESYGPERMPVARRPVRDGAVEDAIARLFADPAVAYLHVRNAEAGCYVARVERAYERIVSRRGAERRHAWLRTSVVQLPDRTTHEPERCHTPSADHPWSPRAARKRPDDRCS